MAVDPWFQTWHPPPHLIADHNIFVPPRLKNFSSPEYVPRSTNTTKGESRHTPADLLPFLLSLGLVDLKKENPKKNSSRPRTLITPKEEELGYTTDHSIFDDLTTISFGDKENFQEKTGPFRTRYAWKQLDYDFHSSTDRSAAIILGEFVPENNLPLGVEVWKNKLFITMPKWKGGIPATLAVLPREPKEMSPLLVPYPSWEWHRTESCAGLTSVFRVQADDCGRLWVLDSGQIEITIKPKQVCPPAIYVFDLETDRLLLRYELPKDFIKQDSLYSNIIVDNRDGDCANVHAYLTDVWRYGLVVFSLRRKKSWRITDHLFYPEPLAAAYKVHDLEFQWTDGLFGLALGLWDKQKEDRILYFHPMSSFREFYVKTNVICNETGWDKVKDAFRVMGQSRGKNGHVSASAIDKNGIMFYNLVTRDSIGCWDSRKPYKRSNLGVVAQHNEKLVFPNDIKVDKEEKQSIWIVTNKLPFYLYSKLDKNKINFRVLSAYTEDAIKGTVCDPNLAYPDSFANVPDGEDCY
ncbi:hypothetical protein HHI36_015867 [Cryptolaemus montrouzieri]|uniref:Uncharacterized protein n=1 Tax=Cryptolaemus montrouzieri TaxID=559131 RepID=A0ABD2N7L4_9CUCU